MNAMTRHMARDMTDLSDKWCILRTNGGRTLKLAAALNAAGIEAWTPERVVKVRKLQHKAPVERTVCIMPTFVFARALYLPALRLALAQPMNPFPGFSVFRFSGQVPLIAEAEIASLRDVERKAALSLRKSRRRTIERGATITPTEGAWAGMTGIVEGCDGKHALVSFGGTFQVKIATWLFDDNELRTAA